MFDKNAKYFKKYKLIVFISLLHSVLLTLVTIIFINQDFVFGDERILYRLTTDFKKAITHNIPDYQSSNIIFINTSYDNYLIDRKDAYGFVVGNQAITDRGKLAKLFNIIGERKIKYQYILCDIFFVDTSTDDSVLNSSIKRLSNFIIPYNLTNDYQIIQPLFEVNRGLSIYKKHQSIFLKFRLTGPDTSKSVPLKMYSDITGKKYSDFLGCLYFFDNKLALNNIIVDQKFKYEDVLNRETKESLPFVNLGELLQLSDSLIEQSLMNRLIVLGDFTDLDMHNTIYGLTPGSIILTNVFYSLKQNENLISLFFIMLFVLVYFLLSINLFSKKDISDIRVFAKLRTHLIGRFITKFLSYVFLISVLSILSYLLFNIHINIVIFAIYFDFADFAIKTYRKRVTKKQKIH